MSAGPVNYICIKWGTYYSADYVNKLYVSIRGKSRDIPRFFCLTDDAEGLHPDIEARKLVEQPYEREMAETQARTLKPKGALRKIAMFDPALFRDTAGPVIALDIDILVLEPLEDLARFAPGKVCMRKPFDDFRVPKTFGEGSVIKFEPDKHAFLYERMARDPVGAVLACGGSEQSYTSMTAVENNAFDQFPAEWIASFKRHCMRKFPADLFLPPRRPEGAKIVAFHGRPKPHEVAAGFRHGILNRTVRTKWAEEAWAST